MAFPYKHFLVLGATSGIGRFVAKYGNERAHATTFDLSKTDDIPAFVKNVTSTYPDIDCVYFNAGTQQAYNLSSDEGWDLKRFNEEVHLNFNSVVVLSHAFLPTGTNLAIIPAAWVSAYSASKAALNVFVLCLREHLKDTSKLKIIEISPSAQGLDQIIGGAPDQEAFDDVLKKRRDGFENLAAMWRKHFRLQTPNFTFPHNHLNLIMAPIPITILTGFLGSGKTTLLLNLLPQLPKSYKLALLKNEFGDLAIDSQLASTSAISGVRELLNGCICCNLVGQLSDALEQLKTEVQPDRIVIETSGSAFPATLAMEVNRLARESTDSTGSGAYVLDGVVSVIDVENWAGYEDTSYTAKIQARYTDLIVFNKWEGVSERRFDECLDRVGDLEVETAWVKSEKGRVDKDVLLGIDGALFAKEEGDVKEGGDHDHDHENGHEHEHGKDRHGHQSEVEVLSVTLEGDKEGTTDVSALESLLSSAPKEEVYRIKGILRCSTSSPPATSSDDLSARPPFSDSASAYYILNWAFGRWTCTTSEVVAGAADPNVIARVTLILARYESGKWKKKLEAGGLVKSSSGEGAELVVERLV
ncbi:CobW/HypB/UreG, nucleotide-binding domain-containing protein [Aspergillus stella-maris]|uniref:CobW/HypB/UreG, nucleotide-binding domain-containing protein n=1 Tax=Aspergillus stella-maris TaxID=1810926 RepID=UPI003CCD3020